MGKKSSLSAYTFPEYIALIWFTLDAFTHLTIELGYVYLALTTTAQRSDTYLGHIWREYGRADARWAVRDPNVISLEILTVCVGILCIFQIYAVATRAAFRHPLQIVICVAELYGGWMTFAPEWVDGSPNLNGSDFSLFWIYLVFMNGLWVVVPALLLWESYSRLTGACRSIDNFNSGVAIGGPSNMWFVGAAVTLVMYMILVPAVLFSAKGVPVSP